MTEPMTLESALAYVGTPETHADVLGITQLQLLIVCGLEPKMTLLEIGAGCLNLGRFAIEFLDPKNYASLEPHDSLVSTGIQGFKLEQLIQNKLPERFTSDNFLSSSTYDRIYSHSVLTHVSRSQLPIFLKAVHDQLNPNHPSLALVSLNLGIRDTAEESWSYPHSITFTKETFVRACQDANLIPEFRPDFTKALIQVCPSHTHDWVILKSNSMKPLLTQITEVDYDTIVTKELSEGAILNTHWPGNGLIEDYLALYCLIRKHFGQSRDTPYRILEIGTHEGRGTHTIAKAAHPSSQILSLDLPPEIAGVSRQHPSHTNTSLGHLCPLPFTQLLGDSRTYPYPSLAPIDGIYIDAEHSYPNVLHESKAAFTLAPSLVIWHDCDMVDVWHGVLAALSEHNPSAIDYNNYLSNPISPTPFTHPLYYLNRILKTRIGFALKL